MVGNLNSLGGACKPADLSWKRRAGSSIRKNKKLENETLGAGAVLASGDKGAEELREVRSGFAGDFDAVVIEERLARLGQEEGEGLGAGRQLGEGEFLDGIEELEVEIVDPEFVEVAKDNKRRAVWDDVRPVVEDLVVLAFELFATEFHLGEHALGPQEIGEVFALGSTFLGEAGFASGPGFLDAVMAEGAEKVIEEIGGFAFFVAGEVGLDIGDEGLEGFGEVGLGGMME
jgi:hypothetical protein